MQTFSRVLTVVVAVISVAFMGFAGVVSFGGPNWAAEARSMEGYTFERAPGDNPVWSATRSEGREELATKSLLLPEVLAAAYKDRADRANAELQELNNAIPELERRIALSREMQAADVPALDRYFQNETVELQNIQEEILVATREQERLASEVRKIEDQLESRRQDVFRTELQHRLLVADLARIQQNVAAVEEQIRLLEDELDKSRRRSEELNRQGVPPAQPQANQPGA
jgi:hypothetical protein